MRISDWSSDVCSSDLYARMMLAPSLRSFSPRDRTILSLARQEHVNARITSVFGRFDPHIPEGSDLPGARNVLLETGGRSEERRGGKVCGSTCRSWWSAYI